METPATGTPSMADETTPPPMKTETTGMMKEGLMFSGDFAGSIAFFDPSKTENNSDFDVNLAQFNVKANMGQSHLNLGFGYGSTVRGLDPGATTDNSTNRLGLLSASYHMKTSYGLGFMLGRFESPVGHETYNHRMNSQFTRSYGFNLAPYFSTGLGVNYGQKMWKVGLLVTNGRGADTDSLDDDLTMAVTVDLDPIDGLHIDLNYVAGKETMDYSDLVSGFTSETNDNGNTDTGDTVVDEIANNEKLGYSVNIIDASVSYEINEMFNVALNYISNTIKPTDSQRTVNSTSLAAYANAKYSRFNFSLRYEQFSFGVDEEVDGGMGIRYNGPSVGLLYEGKNNSVSSITFAAGTEIAQNTGFLLEYRMDKSKDDIWANADGKRANSLNRITAALMYNF